MPAEKKGSQACLESRLVEADRQRDAQRHVVVSVVVSIGWAGVDAYM